MTDHTPLVHAQQVSKYYPDGQVHALVDVNLRVERGEYVAVMGPSGSGKSTLLNLLAGLDLPTSGTIAFDGASLAQMHDLDQFRAAQIGFVFQSFYLLPTLTAVENIQVPMFEGSRRPAERRAAALALLEQVGLSRRAGHLPSQLSVGERQRVAIARALANGPALILADEPTGNLDSQSAGEILDLFDALHRQRGATIVMITHDAQAARRAERTVRIRDGRLDDGSAD